MAQGQRHPRRRPLKVLSRERRVDRLRVAGRTKEDRHLVSAPNAVIDKSRGTQLSVLATTTVHCCRSCDREVLAAYLATEAGRLVMPTELPTTSGDSD